MGKDVSANVYFPDAHSMAFWPRLARGPRKLRRRAGSKDQRIILPNESQRVNVGYKAEELRKERRNGVAGDNDVLRCGSQ